MPPSSEDAYIAHLRIPLTDIVTATGNFAYENLLGKQANVYKGQLFFQSKVWIDVVIHKYSGHVSRFYQEIKRISDFKHKNVVSLIGFCDEKDERMIVMEYVVNGCLDKYLSDPVTLTWSQRLHICFGAAHVTKSWELGKLNSYYLKGFKVLVDKDWEAKVLFSVEYWYDSRTLDARESLGVMLLEVLYGRKATIEDVNRYRDWVNSHYEEGALDDMIDPNLKKQMLPESLSIFLDAAYCCLKEQSDQRRTDLYEIVKMLHKAFDVQWKHENLLRVESFAYLKILLAEIMLATNNFDYTYNILSMYGSVYITDLNHFDKESGLALHGENEGELPKRSLIIKRFTRFSDYDKTAKDFYAEIEMLTSCEHPNLLSFLGFCDEDCEMILVFECDFKEDLQGYLRYANIANHSWEQRIRICLDIAHGFKYLHNMDGKPRMMHHVIQSSNVILDAKGNAKIANFMVYEVELNFKSLSLRQSQPGMFRTWLLAQRHVVDDISCLGKIFLYILTGGVDRLPYMGQQHFHEGHLKSKADPVIMEEAQVSLYTFSEMICQCLTLGTLSERPTIEVIIKSLETVLRIQHTTLQVQKLGHMKIPLEDIKSATNSFGINCLIGSGGYGEVYKAELKMKSKDGDGDTRNSVAIKRITSRNHGQGIEAFLAELDVVSKCKHANIISLLGFCVEDGEMLLVYELASNGSLENYLESIDMMINFTWERRLKLCIDIAQGLKYMHTTIADKEKIIHRDIKSANILLGKNWEAKIADLGLSIIHYGNQGVSTINTNTLAGTQFYLDPEYARTGRLKKASDIYSLGVVLFEIFSGKLAYDTSYIRKNVKGIAAIARRHFKKGTINDLLDPKTMDEVHELGFTGKVEPDHDSLDVFLRIAYQCLANTQVERPTIKVVIEELEKALHFQENRIKTLTFSLEHIKLGVENFSDDNCVMRGRYRMLYKGKVQCNNRHKKVLVKRFSLDKHLQDTSFSWEHGFLKEFEVLFKYKHENIIGLVGYCNEMDEKIIVYEHASKGSLDKYLNDNSFSWIKRLKTCIDIANGLKFLHGGALGQDLVIHRDLKSSIILLNKDWKAKICGFEHALTYPTNQEIDHVIDNVEGSRGYCDPSFHKTYLSSKEADIYSFGVILFEILCGSLACLEDFRDRSQFLDVLVKRHFQEAPLEEMVFEGIKEQIGPKSLATFGKIAFQCLLNDENERPTTDDVVIQLQKALEFQEVYELREGKLHNKYKEISTITKNDIYNILSKGFLLEDDKLEIMRFLKHRTWNLEQSAQLVRKNDDDDHSE